MKVTSGKKEETETKINTISTILKTTRERTPLRVHKLINIQLTNALKAHLSIKH